jgi:hypothetical protein
MEALLARRALIERQLKAITARQNSAERKVAQRAKFLLGQAALAQAAGDPALLERLCAPLAPKDQALVRGVVANHA